MSHSERTESDADSEGQAQAPAPDPEVVPRAKHCQYEQNTCPRRRRPEVSK